MPGNKTIKGLCAAAGMIFCGSVFASDIPEQTVEGAQRFLSQVLPGQGYRPGFLTEFVQQLSRQRGMPNPVIVGEGNIYEVTTVKKCKTILRYDLTPVMLEYYHPSSPYFRRFRLVATEPTLKQGGSPGGFSWGEVVQVERFGSSVDIKFQNSRDTSRIHLNAENMAKRVAYAIEFLRLHCDETAKTGF